MIPGSGIHAGIHAGWLYNSADMSRRASQKGTESEEPELMGEVPADSQLHDLVPFVAGNKLFAVFADHVDGTAEARTVVALPNAPPAVLGLVCLRGRMLTVLDAVAILTGEAFLWPTTLPHVLGLRGDEQLALAAQSCRDTITIAASDIEPLTRTYDNGFESAALGLTRYAGEEITVLRMDNLFAAALRRKERRRRRF
jgi:chemotaxis signal transduction protein